MIGSLDSQARDYEENGKHADAEGLYRQLQQHLAEARGSDHPDTLKIEYRLAMSLARQKRTEEAIALLDQTLMAQRRVLGSTAPDTVKTEWSLVNTLRSAAFAICETPDRSDSDYARAVNMFQRAVDLRPTQALAHCALAWGQFQQKHWQLSLASLEKSVALNVLGGFQWYLMAMNHSQLGDQQTARDWLTFAYEWKFKLPKEQQDPWVNKLTKQALALADLENAWTPTDLTEADYVDVYSRLVAKYPRIAWLHHFRGCHYAEMGQFEKAVADYVKADECMQTMDRSRHHALHLYALSAIYLYLGDLAKSESECKRVIARASNDPWEQRVLSEVCCYLPSGTFDYDKFYSVATIRYARTKSRHYDLGLYLLTAYRSGRYREVVANEQKPITVPALLSVAMAHKRLGDNRSAQEFLERARNRLATQLKTLIPQVITGYADRPTQFCWLSALLREAEALIEPGKQGTETKAIGQRKDGEFHHSASGEATKG
ncbi:MAG: tetratricopeptide repeat protein [Thermoguttaceae bacterium]